MKKKVFSITIAIFIFFGCSDSQDREFKHLAAELRTLLLELQNVWATENIKESDEYSIVEIDLSNKAMFVEKRKDEFNKISDKLETFSTNNEKSKWADDADFLKAINSISISIPGNDMHSEAVKSIRNFLNKQSTFRIEKWTKKYFREIILFYIFDSKKLSFGFSPYTELSNLPEEERIIAFFEFHVFYEYLKGSDLASAENEYERIKRAGRYMWLNEAMESTIDAYRKKHL